MRLPLTFLMTPLLVLAACTPTQEVEDTTSEPATVPTASARLDEDDDGDDANDPTGDGVTGSPSASPSDDADDPTGDGVTGSPSASPSN